jgi:hypothetical protein
MIKPDYYAQPSPLGLELFTAAGFNVSEFPKNTSGENDACLEYILENGLDFCLGNAFKYVWRCGGKDNNPVPDLKKAVFYLEKWAEIDYLINYDARFDFLLDLIKTYLNTQTSETPAETKITTFTEYHTKTEFTRQGKNVCKVYALLGLIGEVGEVVFECTQEIETLHPPDSICKDIERDGLDILTQVLGVCEKAEFYKKAYRKYLLDGFTKPFFDYETTTDYTENLIKEFGGVYWYLDCLVNLHGFDLGDVATVNYNQLKNRFEQNATWTNGQGVKAQ